MTEAHARMVDRTARRRTLAALLICSLVSLAVVLGVLSVSSAIGDARSERSKIQNRLTNLEAEFKARTGQEPAPFETPPSTTTPVNPTTVPVPTSSAPTSRTPSTAPAAPPGRSPSTTGAQPSPPPTEAPAPSQPPPSTPPTTRPCLAAVLGLCVP